jgi:hypothetical protein
MGKVNYAVAELIIGNEVGQFLYVTATQNLLRGISK